MVVCLRGPQTFPLGNSVRVVFFFQFTDWRTFFLFDLGSLFLIIASPSPSKFLWTSKVPATSFGSSAFTELATSFSSLSSLSVTLPFPCLGVIITVSCSPSSSESITVSITSVKVTNLL